jgi:hypothetical protein
MQMMWKIAGTLLALSMLTGCSTSGVKGNGDIKEELREVEAFSRVAMSGAYQLEAKAGQPRQLAVRGDSNLLPLVETTVQDGRLQIRSERNLQPTGELTITLSTPALEGVTVSGAVKGRVTGITGERLVVDLSGTGTLNLAGQVNKLGIEISGAGDVRAAELQAADVKVECNGAGNVEVRADKTLDVGLSGAGKVAYHGDPELTKEVSGVGAVVKE